METETLSNTDRPPAWFIAPRASDQPSASPSPSATPPVVPPSGPVPLSGQPPHQGPRAPMPPGHGPTPDPSRSGARWVGGAGVALLLAAAGVLTAVQWDNIGQSAKLGGLVAITLSLLGAGQRFKNTIPMTAQAIFHLGALLIPFDMAAVATLAGRSWQETLLLTAMTSVTAWYAIERAAPSPLLLWSARAGVVGLAAGIAAVSVVTMPLALAVAAAIAIALRRPTAAGTWAAMAGVLPIAAAMTWPPRIAAAMADLGFAGIDRWQTLASGVIATAVLIATTRLRPQLEIAWAAVVTSLITVIVTLVEFDSPHVAYLTVAALFLSVELLAMLSKSDPLWKEITSALAFGAEVMAATFITVLAWATVFADSLGEWFHGTSIGSAAALVALGWLTADRRLLDEDADWLTAVALGSDWGPATVLVPASILTMLGAFGAPLSVISIAAVVLSYWMVATWRSGAAYGAIALVGIGTALAVTGSPWLAGGVGAAGAAVLMLATRFRLRADDGVAATLAAVAGAVVWIAAAAPLVDEVSSWFMVPVTIGAWALSWIAEARDRTDTTHVADWAGRALGAVMLPIWLWPDPLLGLALCGVLAALAAVDYARVVRSSTHSASPLRATFALAGGAVIGLAGVPIAALAGLTVTTAGAALAVAGFVAVGLALVLPQEFELPVGVAAAVASGVGLAMAFGEAGAFAIAMIAVGCTALFIAAALRDLVIAIAGYSGVALGVALQLAVWEVTWLEAYLFLPSIAVLGVGYWFQRKGVNSWAAYGPTIALFSYVAIASRFGGGSAWHAVIAGAVGVAAIIVGGYRRLIGPLLIGSGVLAVVVGYESLGPAALVPTWAWLATGGTVLLSAGVIMERGDISPLERGQHLRQVIATEFS